ncbi:MAG: hypothetical protein RI954_909, partial [Actinomycetota bacterium]
MALRGRVSDSIDTHGDLRDVPPHVLEKST